MYLSGSNSPNMAIGNIKFNGLNYLAWARSVKIGFGAKTKLGFIDGSLPKPRINSPDLAWWERADYMVRIWILNSMEKEITQIYVFTSSTLDLRNEIMEQYGHSNGPLIFQLQHEISTLR